MNSNRDYYYDINDRGVLTLDGLVLDDPDFLDFFFRRLAPTANPHYADHPYVSRCGEEMNYLSPQDTPIVYTGFDGDRLLFAHSLSVLMRPDRLAYSADGVLYHGASVGEYARIVPQVAMELAQYIEPWGPYFAFRDLERHRLVPIMPLADTGKIEFLRPRDDNQCVGCGGANPFSLQQSFVHNLEDGSVSTWVRPDFRMQGALGTTHGGFVSLLLDETMGKCLSLRNLRAPTASLKVAFRKPMNLGEEYVVRAWVKKQHGRKNEVLAEIHRTDDPDSIVAEAEALFITIGTKA